MSNIPYFPLWSKARTTLTDVPFAEGQMVIQLLEEPAFSSWTCWTVILKKGYFTVKQVIWDAQKDIHHVENLGKLIEPFTLSLDKVEVPLEIDKLSPVIDKGSKISIPLVNVSFDLGSDGVTYTLSQRFFPRQLSLTWWGEGPEVWHELTTWAMELRSFFKEYIAKTDLPPKLD